VCYLCVPNDAELCGIEDFDTDDEEWVIISYLLQIIISQAGTFKIFISIQLKQKEDYNKLKKRLITYYF